MKRGKIRLSVEVLKQILNLRDDITLIGVDFIPKAYCVEIHLISQDCPDVLEGALNPKVDIEQVTQDKKESIEKQKVIEVVKEYVDPVGCRIDVKKFKKVLGLK